MIELERTAFECGKENIFLDRLLSSLIRMLVDMIVCECVNISVIVYLFWSANVVDVNTVFLDK